MVKGISKRVIVVKSPVSNLFDEAIFILNEGMLSSSVDSENLLREACAAADEYVRRHCDNPPKRKRAAGLLLAGVFALCLLSVALAAYFIAK